MTKEKIIIVLLLLALIYLYYQNKKLKGLPAQKIFVASDTSAKETLFEINDDESKEELIAEKDAAIRDKNEAEAEVLSLSNQLRNKQQEVGRKETEIERLKKEKSNSEISLNKKITEKNGLITTLQREINQQKGKIEQLGTQISKSPLPGSFPESAELEQKQGEFDKSSEEALKASFQGQLREIYSLFDLRANGMKEIDFNQLMEMLKGVKRNQKK